MLLNTLTSLLRAFLGSTTPLELIRLSTSESISAKLCESTYALPLRTPLSVDRRRFLTSDTSKRAMSSTARRVRRVISRMMLRPVPRLVIGRDSSAASAARVTLLAPDVCFAACSASLAAFCEGETFLPHAFRPVRYGSSRFPSVWNGEGDAMGVSSTHSPPPLALWARLGSCRDAILSRASRFLAAFERDFRRTYGMSSGFIRPDI